VYCQDNETSWLNWDLADDQKAFLAFVKSMTLFRREQPALHRRKFFQGRSIRGAGVTDVTWFTPAGDEMTDADWDGSMHSLGLRLAGDLIDETDERGEPIVGDSLLVLMNAHHEPVTFMLPATRADQRWELVVDTGGEARAAASRYAVGGRTTAVFRTRPAADPAAVPIEVAGAGP
jgi:glycogen operon protein